MKVETELKPLFSYSILPIILVIVVIGILVFFIVFKKKKIPIKETIIIPDRKNIIDIKRTYLNKIDNLLSTFNENKINNRHAYQSLSKLIRNFIFEVTNIKVQNYTLNDIKQIKIPYLYELVSEYYEPEFAKISRGDIRKSIEKTRKVIEKWN